MLKAKLKEMLRVGDSILDHLTTCGPTSREQLKSSIDDPTGMIGRAILTLLGSNRVYVTKDIKLSILK